MIPPFSASGKNELRKSITTALLVVLVFMLPLFQQVSVICLGLVFMVNLLRKDILEVIRIALMDKVNCLLILFYFFHLAGLLYSDNLRYATADLQTKISYVLFPLLMPAFYVDRKNLHRIIYGLVAGCTIACIVCLSNSYRAYRADHDPAEFIYEHFSILLHPTYFTLYLNLAFILALEHLVSEWKHSGVFFRVLFIALASFLFISIILAGARTATATSWLTACILSVFLIFQNRSWIKGSLILIICMVLAASFQYATMQVGKERAAQITGLFKEQPAKFNSANVRIYLWKYAGEVIQEHPVWGVGTGDFKDELIKKYKENNFDEGIKKNYNPHNQYLHTTVMLGFIGLVVLLCLLILPLLTAFRYREVIYFLFLLMILFNNLTEDVLEVQKGVIFFALFNTLFYSRMAQHIKNYLA